MNYTITTRVTDRHFNELVKAEEKAYLARDIRTWRKLHTMLDGAVMADDMTMIVTFPCQMPSAEFMARISEGC